MITDKKEIYKELKAILSAFSKNMKVTEGSGKSCGVYCTKTVTVGKKVVEGMYFASAAIQGGFVGFYFFPIYTHPKEFTDMPENLRKCLKGKSCFHIKKLDSDLSKSIKAALKKGFGIYKKAGWM